MACELPQPDRYPFTPTQLMGRVSTRDFGYWERPFPVPDELVDPPPALGPVTVTVEVIGDYPGSLPVYSFGPERAAPFNSEDPDSYYGGGPAVFTLPRVPEAISDVTVSMTCRTVKHAVPTTQPIIVAINMDGFFESFQGVHNICTLVLSDTITIPKDVFNSIVTFGQDAELKIFLQNRSDYNDCPTSFMEVSLTYEAVAGDRGLDILLNGEVISPWILAGQSCPLAPDMHEFVISGETWNRLTQTGDTHVWPQRTFVDDPRECGNDRLVIHFDIPISPEVEPGPLNLWTEDLYAPVAFVAAMRPIEHSNPEEIGFFEYVSPHAVRMDVQAPPRAFEEPCRHHYGRMGISEDGFARIYYCSKTSAAPEQWMNHMADAVVQNHDSPGATVPLWEKNRYLSAHIEPGLAGFVGNYQTPRWTEVVYHSHPATCEGPI